MKSFSHALMAALLAGGVMTAATPAFAKDKKEAEGDKAPALKLSNEVRTPAAAAQKALAENNVAAAEPLVAQVEAAAKTDDEKYIAASMRLNIEAKKNNEAGISAPLKVLVASPRTAQADKARYSYELGRLAAKQKNMAEANTYLQQAKSLGYNDPNLSLQLVQIKADGGDLPGASADMDAAIQAQAAAGQKPSEDLYRFMISRANKAKNGQMTYEWLRKWVAAYPTQKNWRETVLLTGLQSGGIAAFDKGQKVDLFRLLRTNKALADQYDYEIYAQSAFDLGLPYESKTVLTEGKAAGKIPADSANANSILKASTTSIAAEGSLSGPEAKAKSAANGKLAAGTGDAYLGSGNYPKAIELYRLALQKGGVDADAVNTRLGIALANTGDKAGAKAAFETVKTAPRSYIAGLWIESLDHPPVG